MAKKTDVDNQAAAIWESVHMPEPDKLVLQDPVPQQDYVLPDLMPPEPQPATTPQAPAPQDPVPEVPQYAAGTGKYLRENLPATPKGMTPCAHVNLKISKELVAYLDVEKFRFGMTRTELINKILLAYAKENPHL